MFSCCPWDVTASIRVRLCRMASKPGVLDVKAALQEALGVSDLVSVVLGYLPGSTPAPFHDSCPKPLRPPPSSPSTQARSAALLNHALRGSF
jgi:hypothetical protein